MKKANLYSGWQANFLLQGDYNIYKKFKIADSVSLLSEQRLHAAPVRSGQWSM
jgi:hypothetical protein